LRLPIIALAKRLIPLRTTYGTAWLFQFERSFEESYFFGWHIRQLHLKYSYVVCYVL